MYIHRHRDSEPFRPPAKPSNWPFSVANYICYLTNIFLYCNYLIFIDLPIDHLYNLFRWSPQADTLNLNAAIKKSHKQIVIATFMCMCVCVCGSSAFHHMNSPLCKFLWISHETFLIKYAKRVASTH